MRFDTVVSKPAASSRPARAVTREEIAPSGSPTMSPRPKPWRPSPGSTIEQVACTTQPIT